MILKFFQKNLKKNLNFCKKYKKLRKMEVSHKIYVSFEKKRYVFLLFTVIGVMNIKKYLKTKNQLQY